MKRYILFGEEAIINAFIQGGTIDSLISLSDTLYSHFTPFVYDKENDNLDELLETSEEYGGHFCFLTEAEYNELCEKI